MANKRSKRQGRCGVAPHGLQQSTAQFDTDLAKLFRGKEPMILPGNDERRGHLNVSVTQTGQALCGLLKQALVPR